MDIIGGSPVTLLGGGCRAKWAPSVVSEIVCVREGNRRTAWQQQKHNLPIRFGSTLLWDGRSRRKFSLLAERHPNSYPGIEVPSVNNAEPVIIIVRAKKGNDEENGSGRVD